MITPEQRAELRRLRAALPQQELFFDYFKSLNQMMAYDADRDSVADVSSFAGLSAMCVMWLLYVAYAATVAPALLDALDAAEQRAAELEQRVSILTEYRDAMMEGIGIDPSEINTYSPLALKGIAEVLYAAEQRVAELVRAVRAVYAADHPINEMHAERALRQLVYKNGGEE